MYVKRREEILTALKDTPTLSVRDLSDGLKVSEMTIRRDLAKMEAEGVVQRYFGGVRASDLPLLQQATNVRASSMTQAKRRIAAKAASLVGDGDAVILDCGTTILELSRLLVQRPITIVTSYLLIASMQQRINATIHLSGGELFDQYKIMIGRKAEEFYEGINCKYAFLSAAGLHVKRGVTEYTGDEAALKRVMLEHAKTRVLLMDSSKFGIIQTFRAVELGKIDILITDKKPPKEYMTLLKKNGVEVIVAQ